jgi:hypothetical protein
LLRPFGRHIRVFGGIANNTTSRQGLEHLFEIGVELNVVDTGRSDLIFHPKVFLAQGRDEMRALIGSANLTRGGLSQNVETGVFLRLNLGDAGDQTIIEQLSTKFIEPLELLGTRYPKNVRRIGDLDALLRLAELGLIADERHESCPEADGERPRPVFDAEVPPLIPEWSAASRQPSMDGAVNHRTQSPDIWQFVDDFDLSAIAFPQKPLNEHVPTEEKKGPGFQFIRFGRLTATVQKSAETSGEKRPRWVWDIQGSDHLKGRGSGSNAKNTKDSPFEIAELYPDSAGTRNSLLRISSAAILVIA